MVVSTIAAEPRVAAPGRAPGVGTLRIVRGHSRSVAAHVYATSPLRLLTPANHGHAAWVFTSSFGGGLVDGDRLRLRVEVEEGASAYLSTQASTKVYKSPRGTTSGLRGSVAPDALLIVAPDPVVCYADARFAQVQEFDVAASGGLVVLDWFTAGRHRRGERWAFAHYESTLVIRLDGREVAHDVIALRTIDGSIADRFGRFAVMATVALAGGGMATEASSLLARAGNGSVTPRADELVAAAPLAGGGCLIRIAGTSFQAVAASVRDFLDFVPVRLGDSPWDRKW